MTFATGAARAIAAAVLMWNCAASAQAAAPAAGDLKPPPELLIPCDQAPKGAVTRLAPELASWAAVYCTKYGQIFNANDQHFGAFPDSGLRATFGSGEIDGKSGSAASDTYFSGVAYAPFTDAELQQLLKIDPIASKIVGGKALHRLDLVTGGGNQLTFLVIDPSSDPFWVFPLTDKGLGSPAFFVATAAAVKRTR